MAETTTLTCPKCGADMRTYERNGVVVDQCSDREHSERHKKSRKRSFLENLFEGE